MQICEGGRGGEPINKTWNSSSWNTYFQTSCYWAVANGHFNGWHTIPDSRLRINFLKNKNIDHFHLSLIFVDFPSLSRSGRGSIVGEERAYGIDASLPQK